jgi:hypothetical protein
MYLKGSKMLAKWYFDFRTKNMYVITIIIPTHTKDLFGYNILQIVTRLKQKDEK